MNKLSKIRRQKNFRGDDSGLTLVELLVGVFAGSAVLGIAFAGALANRNFFVQDLVQTNANQTVRTVVDVVGLDVRQVGENLGTAANFPALQVTRSSSNSNSRMIIRQNPLIGLRACEAPSGTTVTTAISVTFSPGSGNVTVGSDTVPITANDFISLPANSDGVSLERVNNPIVAAALDASQLPGCAIGADLNTDAWPDDTLEKWRNLRLDNAARGRTTQAYIFDPDFRDTTTTPPTVGRGEFFIYSAETGATTATVTLNPTAGLPTRTATITRYTLSRSTGSWPTGTPAGSYLYVVEQRDYQLVNGTLQVVVNGDTANPLALINGLQSFQVRVNRSSDPSDTVATTGTIKEDFCWQNATNLGGLAATIPNPPGNCGTNNQWSQIRSVDVTATGINEGQGLLQATSTLTERFLPRSTFSF